MRQLRATSSGSLLVDAGDTIQGTPLAYQHVGADPHPMAVAMNALGYDAAAVGNHEFNFGLGALRSWQRQLNFPLLAANITTISNQPAFDATSIIALEVGAPRRVRVGLVGITTPGSALWDRDNVEGILQFGDPVRATAQAVAHIRDQVDVVIILAHSGVGPGSSYGDALPYPENVCAQIAEHVDGIDAILSGHAHVAIDQLEVRNRRTGRPVIITSPLMYGMRLAVLKFELVHQQDRFIVQAVNSHLLDTAALEADPQLVQLAEPFHSATVARLNTTIGSASEPMPLARAVVEPTAAMNLINHVQATAVRTCLGRTDPVLSMAAPVRRDGGLPAGPITIANIASMYPFDNTLYAISLSGDQLRDYLEHSARYYRDRTIPEFNLDIGYGLDADLCYEIDPSHRVGSQISNVTYDSRPITSADRFIVAINNYRAAGSGGYPHIGQQQSLITDQLEIRQLLIDWVLAHSELKPVGGLDTWQLRSAPQR